MQQNLYKWFLSESLTCIQVENLKFEGIGLIFFLKEVDGEIKAYLN